MSSVETRNDLWRRLNPVLLVTVLALAWAINESVFYATIAFATIALAIVVEVVLMVFGVARHYKDNEHNNRLYRCRWVRLYCALPLVLVLLLALYAAYCLRSHSAGVYLIWWPVIIAVAADVGAYAGGRYFGGARISEALSQGKTWSGLLFGIVVGGVLGTAFMLALGWEFFSTLLTKDLSGFVVLLILFFIPSALQAAAAMIADLGGSGLKRVCGVKDSSLLFGAHGGALDRLGSHLTTVIVAAASVWLLDHMFTT